MLTPPGPISRPTMIRTTPATTPPRRSVTMPAITRITARIQSNVAAPPVSARTPNMWTSCSADPRDDVPGQEGQDRQYDDHDRCVLDRGVSHQPGTFRLAYFGRVCVVVLRVRHPHLLVAPCIPGARFAHT